MSRDPRPRGDATAPRPRAPRPPADAGRDELDAVLGRVRIIDWLVLAVAAGSLAVQARSAAAVPWLSVAAIVAFALFNAWLRTPGFPVADPSRRIAASVGVTGAFVALVAWQSGGASSPLFNLYLAPLLLAAATLRRRLAWLTFGLVAAGYGLLAWSEQHAAVDWPATLARAIGQLGPFAVATYLVERLAGTALGIRRRLKQVTEFDELTGLQNRRTFEHAWSHEHAAAEAAGAQYCLLLVALDELDRLNDQRGRSAGDAALVALASAIQRSVRSGDLSARYGSGEFAVLLPGATPEVGNAVAQRIRNSVFGSLFQAGGRAQRGTAAVGVAHFPRDARSIERLSILAGRRVHEDRELRRPPGESGPPPGTDG